MISSNNIHMIVEVKGWSAIPIFKQKCLEICYSNTVASKNIEAIVTKTFSSVDVPVDPSLVESC